MNRKLKSILMAAALVTAVPMLSGCALLGIERADIKAETTRQRIVQAELAFQLLVQRAVAYIEADRLSPDAVLRIDQIIRASYTALDAANSAALAGDEAGAAMNYTIMQAMILELQAILQQANDLNGPIKDPAAPAAEI